VELFGRPAKDRARLRATIEATNGPTDVARLAAELRWTPTRVRRALEEVDGASDGIRYDRALGTVELAPPGGSSGAVPAVPPASPAPATPVIEVPSTAPGACEDCRNPLSPTGTPGTFYCARCGTLVTRPGSVPTARGPGPSGAPPPRDGGAGLDPQRSQELFAAWVTDQPIRCPNCRAPLSHKGVESYACPACGERVTFRDGGVIAEAAPRA
jgi:predicted RNA-binding Zn-ribbon protein involved in translation (DUF1610 family)